jgi:DNA modification methylase
MFSKRNIADKFSPTEHIVVYCGDCMELLATVPDQSLQLVITSPPYNIGKEYEKRLKLEIYLEQQAAVIRECVRCLSPCGSICWQVGNYVNNGSIIPLDTVLYPIFTELGLKMRNRIVRKRLLADGKSNQSEFHRTIKKQIRETKTIAG